MSIDTDTPEYGWVSRNLKYWLVYEWKAIHTDQMFSASQATERYRDLEQLMTEQPNIARQDVTIDTYGKRVTHKLPLWTPSVEHPEILVPDAESNITKQFYDYLVQRAKWKMLSDNILGIWQSLLKTHNIALIKKVPVLFSLNKTQESISKDHQNIDEEEQIRQTAIILMKEYLDGYYMRKDYKLSIKSMFTKEKMDFPIKKTYNLSILDQETGLPMDVELKDNYTAGLRYAIFSEVAKDKWRDVDEHVENTKKSRPLLQRWQYDVIKRMWKRTLFSCPRRQGKTLLMVFLALRAVMKHNPKAQFRPTSVLYLGLTEKALTPVLHYIRKMTQAFGEAWEQMFHYDSKFGILSFKEWKDILGTITFLSAEWRSPGVGFFADDIFIDEAHLIWRDIYDGIEPIITHEWASLVAASTMYKHIKKGRFYDLLTEYEKESMTMWDIDDIILDSWKKGEPLTHNAGLRYTIDDNEFLPDVEKEKIKKQYSADPQKYLAELYSRFPDEGKIFKYESTLRESTTLLTNNYKYVVHWYDPARTQDKSALITCAYNEHLNKICILEEHVLNKVDASSYDQQAEQIKNLRKSAEQYVNNPNEIFLSMDWTQKATAEILELKWVPVHLRIAYHAGINITKTAIRNEMRVPKKHLINIAKILFDNDKIIMSNNLLGLQQEMDSFYELYDDATGNITYSWVGAHDDHVNALLVALYYFYEQMWLKNILIPQKSLDEAPAWSITKEELRKWNKEKEDIKLTQKRKDDNERYFQKFIY